MKLAIGCVFAVMLGAACSSSTESGDENVAGSGASGGAAPGGAGGSAGASGSTDRAGSTSGGTASAGTASGGSGNAGSGNAGSGGTSPGSCGASTLFSLQSAPEEISLKGCVEACSWFSLRTPAGVEIPVRGALPCDPLSLPFYGATSWSFDGRLPTGACLAPGNYVARMCARPTAPPPNAAPAPNAETPGAAIPPDDAPPLAVCIPAGAEECVDVPFTYPTNGNVVGTLDIGG